MRALALSVLGGTVLAETSVFQHIHGYDRIGHGFDAVTLEDRAFPIVERSWDQGKTWYLPANPDEVFDVPDNVVVQEHAEAILMNYSQAYSDVYDFQQETQHRKKSHGFMGFGSKSKTTYHYVRTYYEKQFSMALSFQEFVYMDLTLLPLPPPRVHPRIESMIERLPAVYDSNPDSDSFKAYRAFIEQVGTHYYTKVSMGGNVLGQTWYHKCILAHWDTTWVEKQSGWSFFGIIGSQKGSHDQIDSVDQKFLENSYTSTDLHGGDVLKVDDDPANWPLWVETIKLNMVPVRSEIAPLTDLLGDNPKQGQLIAAIADYGKEGQLELDTLVKDLAPKDPLEDPDWCVNPAP